MNRPKRWTRTVCLALALAAGATGMARAGDVRVHGLLDVVAAERGLAFEHNTTFRGDNPFDAYGLRLYVDGAVNAKLNIFTQTVMRGALDPYLDGAYLMFTPSSARDLHVLAGKIPWPVGTYAPRTYSNHNPLIGSPLLYQYHTTLVWYAVVPSADVLLAAAGTGQFAVSYFGEPMSRGSAIVDDAYWDVGATVTGSERRLEYALSVTAGTPSWGSVGEDENGGKSVLGRLGVAPWPGVRLGVSGSYGPYFNQAVTPGLPPGDQAEDYHQKLGMADVEVVAGHLEVRAEGATNVWETPTVGNLVVRSGYVELKYLLSFGGYLAGRWDAMRFGKIRDSAGAEHTWDSNVTRTEAGLGYRIDRDTVAKLVVQRWTIERAVGGDQTLPLVAAQLSVVF